MGACEVAKVSCGPFAGDGAFGHSGQRWGVVRPGADGGVFYGVIGCQHAQLSHHGGLFEVAVGDAACQVVGRHQFVLHSLGESVSPQVCFTVGVEEHSTHACFCRVSCSYERRFLGNYFGQVCGP
jgi:hypothetical protein